jgi:predicted DNA-binding transcriptional regulator YafY
MSRSQRLLALLQALRRRRRPVTACDLARELSVSVRTIYRDIATLVEQGAPIDGEAGLGYLMRPGFLLPPLMFQDDEVEALVLGARWVAQQPDTALARAAHDAVAKIEAVLPPVLRARLADAALFAVPRASVAADLVDLGRLRAAIREQRKLRLTYRDRDGRETERLVWPLALAFHEQVRVLVAWCELRCGFRHFRTDRITTLLVSSEPVPRPRAALLEEWRAAEGIEAGQF